MLALTIVIAVLIRQNVTLLEKRSAIENAVSADRGGVSPKETRKAPAPPGTPIRIYFQPATAPAPQEDSLVDSGALFGDRDNGYRYGWAVENPTAHDRNAPNDVGGPTRLSAGTEKTTARGGTAPEASVQRYGSLIHTQWAGIDHVWEIEVPNGVYSVRLVAGDLSFFDSFYIVNVEGAIAVNAIPTSDNRWIEGHVRVRVADRRLTISNARGACNNKLVFIEIIPAAADLPIGAVVKTDSARPKPRTPAGSGASPRTGAIPATENGSSGGISGVIRASTGAPLAGVRVAAISVEGKTGVSALLSLARTDASGRYVLENLRGGRYNVAVGSLVTPLYHPGTNIADGATTFTVSGNVVAAGDFAVNPARVALVCPEETGPKE
jgi:hypothetical protein